MSLEQTESQNPLNIDTTEQGGLHIEAKSESTSVVTPVPTAELEAKIPAPQRALNRTGTIEHLAARRPTPPLDAQSPEVKQRLSELRPEITTLVTDLRWGGVSVQDTTERLIPLLNVGSLQQWVPVLVPFILEIDRAGNLVPAWLKVIEQDDDADLPPDGNPAETMTGRARRFAMLMLGNYKSPELSQLLGKLASDPNTSLYATQSLVKQATTPALQALVSALKDAEGWAKVDIVEACLTLNQTRFHDILLASGLDRVAGLESYIAIPIFRSISLERYLRGGIAIAPRLVQQAAMIFAQVLQDSMKTISGPPGTDALPVVFERNLAPLATALFEGARSAPNWQNVLAVHRLATLLGRYWGEISRGTVQDPRILESVYACLPMMPEIERWMNGPGRDVLLESLTRSDEETSIPVVKVLGELRDPRAISILVSFIEATTGITSREQALRLGHICDALGRLGDNRAVQPMIQLVERSVNVVIRAARPKRRDNLPVGDPDIPGSIVYAAVIRALGQLNDRNSLDFIIRAANDFDPYVRTETLEILKRIDPTGSDLRSQAAARQALNDPRDSTARLACQLVAQYQDTNAISSLQSITQTRPELAPAAHDALKRLGQ